MTARILMTLLVATLIAGTVAITGCATTVSHSQEATASAGVRVAAAAYITRGKTQAEQAKRAAQLLNLSAALHAHIGTDGMLAVNLDGLGAYASEYLSERTDLTDGDRVLAQLVVNEILLQAADASAQMPSIGAVNAALLLRLLAQVDRVAALFVLPPATH